MLYLYEIFRIPIKYKRKTKQVHVAKTFKLALKMFTDDGNIFFVCGQDEFSGQIFWNSFGDDGDGLDAGEAHGVDGDVVGRPEGGEVDDDIDFRVL